MQAREGSGGGELTMGKYSQGRKMGLHAMMGNEIEVRVRDFQIAKGQREIRRAVRRVCNPP